MFLSESILVDGSIADCFQLLDENAIAFGPNGDTDEGYALAIRMWQSAGLLPARGGEERAIRSSLSFELIAFRNACAILDRWADLAVVAEGRRLPIPDKIAAIAALSESGTGFAVAPTQWLHSHRRPAPEARFVQVTDEDLDRDDRACDCWGESEEAVIRSMASEIRVPDSISIVTFVHPDNLEVFYRNWHAWRFPRGVPVKVVARGLEPEVLFFVRPEQAKIHFLNTGAETDVAISVREVASLIETEHWVLLDPHWYPLPGAELFMHEDWRAFDLVVAEPGDSTAPVSESKDSAASPAPAFALFRTSFAPTGGSAPERDLRAAATRANGRVAECDPELMGWRRVGSPQDTELEE